MSEPAAEWNAESEQDREMGTAAGDQLAGVTATPDDLEQAVPADEGPELPGEPGDSAGHA